jgi:hypothetical protein
MRLPADDRRVQEWANLRLHNEALAEQNTDLIQQVFQAKRETVLVR